MDHRHAQRISKKMQAKVYIDPKTFRSTSTINVSMHGIFLRLRDPALARHRILKIELKDPDSVFSWHTRAMVVHTSRQGSGFLLEKDLPRAIYQSNKQVGKHVLINADIG